jgi:hypothetical protein
MVRRIASRGWLVLLALAACGDDEQAFDPTLAVGVETQVSPTSITAGEHTTVACVRVNGRGEPLAGGTFGMTLDPSTGAVAQGMDLMVTAAGTRQVACVDIELNLRDATPVPLEVRPGPAATTALTLTPSQILAGDTAAVTCVARDAYGNTTEAALSLIVTPNASVVVGGLASVSATTAGQYEVMCSSTAVPVEARQHATLTVTPAARAALGLALSPVQPAYGTGQPITVKGYGIDRFGNRIEGEIPVTAIDATPPGHHRVSGDLLDKVRFDLEGKYTISAQSTDDPPLTATAPVVVDITPPVLVIKSPERGLVTRDLTEVTVSGTVTDNLGEIASLRIGDIPVTVPREGGNFSARIPLAYGVNLLDIHAADPYGLETMATRAVEKSTEYHAMEARDFATDGITNGVALVLTQEIFDDLDHNEPTRDDLSSLFEFIIANIDFTGFVPNPLTSFSCIGGTCQIRMTSIKMDDVNVAMTLTNGRIHMRVELVRLSGVISLFFPCDVPVLCATRPIAELPGTIKTNAVILDTDIAVSIVNGETVTRAENTRVVIDGLEVSIPDPTGLAQAAIAFVVTAIRDPLIGIMQALVVTVVEDQVQSALGGLFSALNLDQRFDIPSPVAGQPANTVIMKTQARGIDIAPERLQLRVDGLAHTETPRRPHPHLGSIAHTGCAPAQSLTFPPPQPMVLGLHDDLINQLLFAMWEGGTTTLDLGPEESAALLGGIGLQGAHIVIDALLPPVFDSCGAAAGEEVVEIGDLWIEAEADFGGEPLHLGLWILTEAGVTVDFANNAEGALAATLAIGEFDPFWIEVVINEGAFADNDEGVVALVKDTLIPMLLDQFADQLTFALPSFDLSAMTSAVPVGTVVNLDVRAVGRDNAYLTVQGGLK